MKPAASGSRSATSLPVIGSTVGLTLGVLGVLGVPGVPGVPGVWGIFSPRTFVTGVLTVLVSLVGFVSPGVATVAVLVNVPAAALPTSVVTVIGVADAPAPIAPAWVQVTV